MGKYKNGRTGRNLKYHLGNFLSFYNLLAHRQLRYRTPTRYSLLIAFHCSHWDLKEEADQFLYPVILIPVPHEVCTKVLA